MSDKGSSFDECARLALENQKIRSAGGDAVFTNLVISLQWARLPEETSAPLKRPGRFSRSLVSTAAVPARLFIQGRQRAG